MAESEKSTGLGFRKWIILAVVYIETFFHTRLLFGWTLIKNIYKKVKLNGRLILKVFNR